MGSRDQQHYEMLPLEDDQAEVERTPSHDSKTTTCTVLGFCMLAPSALASLAAMFVSAWLLWDILHARTAPDSPILAATRNGTYRAAYCAIYNQYHFLGMPYAQPPLGSGRFRRPRPMNMTWKGERTAQQYSPHCIGYGDHQEAFRQSEDCLTINVIRSASKVQGLLPVAVYVYGGGSHGGGTSDGRYNMSFIVSHGDEIGLPFIGVTFNYRSSIWGLITSKEVTGTRNTNLGLHDQRMALRWVQENIRAFGGDPTKVTLWGASSGAENVGAHLAAYSGRNDKLFRAAILHSGGPIFRAGFRHARSQEIFSSLVRASGCGEHANSLDCLRHVPVEALNRAFVDSIDGESFRMQTMSIPTLDANMLSTYGSISVKESRVVSVPILTGVVTHEGVTWIPAQVRNSSDLRQYLIEQRQYPPTVVDELMSPYMSDATSSEKDRLVLDPPIKSIASSHEFAVIERLLGDVEINASQRLVCQTWARLSSCYSFRFDAVPFGGDVREGVVHGAEIAPLFRNANGLGFERNPFLGKAEGYHEMSRLMASMWIGFITGLDPNIATLSSEPKWAEYALDRPQNFVFTENGSYLEPDIGRKEAIDFINKIQHSTLDK